MMPNPVKSPTGQEVHPLAQSVRIGGVQIAGYTYEEGTNRLIKLDYGNGDRVEYSYDSQGRVICQTYETGETVTYIYDEENNVSSMTEVINGVSKTYSYTYNEDNRLTSMTVDGVTVEYTYDSFGRLSEQVTKQGDTVILTEQTDYNDTDTTASNQVVSYNGFTYTYDDNGNILSVSDGTNTTSYIYDSQNQLIRENNQAQGFTHAWIYDNAGNILLRKEYAYTTGTLRTAEKTVEYQYNASAWGDMLTSYNGNTISYDRVGNPTKDGTWNYTWKHGRQLVSMTDGSTTWNYTYNADGLRTQRANSTDTYTYVYKGSQLTAMTKGTDTLYFTYDASSMPLAVVYNGTTYYYSTNLQGDVIGILNGSGSIVASYAYDAWGNLLSVTGTMADTLGTVNPLRYRGYVYDIETELYYLQSRYYNPEWGRFIDADSRLNRSLGILGINQFSYCLNNPVSTVDYDGKKPGDLFDTMDEAARDFAKYINGTSITDNREYYSYIYTVKVRTTKTYINPNILGYSWLYWFWDGLFGGSLTRSVTVTETKYTYKEPVKGATDNVILQAAASLLSPKVAMLHTHGGYDSKYASDVFSDTDKQFADLLNLPFYVATPLGTLRKYSPSDGSDIELYGDFPFDPNHPGR